MIVKISVTKYCISKGCKLQASTCPVALAINKQLKNKVDVKVTPKFLSIYDSKLGLGNHHQIKTPLKVEAFIESFDRGFEVKPFSFNLNVPKKYLKKVTV